MAGVWIACKIRGWSETAWLSRCPFADVPIWRETSSRQPRLRCDFQRRSSPPNCIGVQPLRGSSRKSWRRIIINATGARPLLPGTANRCRASSLICSCFSRGSAAKKRLGFVLGDAREPDAREPDAREPFDPSLSPFKEPSSARPSFPLTGTKQPGTRLFEVIVALSPCLQTNRRTRIML